MTGESIWGFEADRLLMTLVVAWANAFFAILACWTVLGRGYWFWRAATLAGALGALLLDWLIGLAIEGMGVVEMGKHVEQFPHDARAEAIRQLLELDNDVPDLDAIVVSDRAWTFIAAGWSGRLAQRINDLTGTPDWNIPFARDQASAKLRLLIAALAIHNYRDEHGAWPATLADLCPDYLPAVPRDPFGGQPLVYRLRGDGYALYSVGKNLIDNGGSAERFEYSEPLDILLVELASEP